MKWLVFSSSFILWLNTCGLAYAMPPKNAWQVQLAGGIADLQAADSERNLYPGQSWPDRNQQQNAGEWASWTVKVGGGYLIMLEHWFPMLELQLNGYYLQGSITGNVDELYQFDVNCPDPPYHMDLQSTRLMLDTALTFFTWHDLSIYGLAGLGSAWNSINYLSDAKDASKAVKINAHTQINFAYEFGAGLSYALTEQFSIKLEYLYTDLGKIKLGKNAELVGEGKLSEMETEPFNVNAQALLVGLQMRF